MCVSMVLTTVGKREQTNLRSYTTGTDYASRDIILGTTPTNLIGQMICTYILSISCTRTCVYIYKLLNTCTYTAIVVLYPYCTE